jgi:hypothetical protein
VADVGPRDYPIVFPLATLPHVNLGPILIAACLLALMAPRLGAMSVTVLFAYGMAADQTRMQPEFFSLPLLLWGSLPSARARLTGRVSLVSLWFLAGFHKLLSSDFLHDAGPRLVMALPLPLMPEFVQYLHSGRRAKHCGTVSTTVGFSGSRVLSGWFAANRAPVNQVRGVDPGAIRKAEENP